jgi:P-type conjugative transfer protein TrbJ
MSVRGTCRKNGWQQAREVMSHGRWWSIPLITAACATTPVCAAAQWTVEDPWNLAYNVKHYGEQLYQARMQVQQLESQLAAMRHLATFPARDARQPLQVVSSVMGQAGTLGYAAGNVGGTFQRYFNPTEVIGDWVPSQTAKWQATLDVIRRAMLSTNAQQATLGPGMAAVTRIQTLNTGLVGHEQALELQNSSLVYSAEELMLLRQQLMAQTNLQAAYYAHELTRRAQEDTTLRAIVDVLATPVATGPRVSLRIAP